MDSLMELVRLLTSNGALGVMAVVLAICLLAIRYLHQGWMASESERTKDAKAVAEANASLIRETLASQAEVARALEGIQRMKGQ